MRKQTADAQSAIQALIAAWEPRLDLPGVEVTHKFHETEMDPTGDAEGVGAVTVSKWHYRSATVNWYLPHLTAMQPDDLEWMVVHEYCHILNAPIEAHVKAGSDEYCEHAAENVARALLKAHNS